MSGPQLVPLVRGQRIDPVTGTSGVRLGHRLHQARPKPASSMSRPVSRSASSGRPSFTRAVASDRSRTAMYCACSATSDASSRCVPRLRRRRRAATCFGPRIAEVQTPPKNSGYKVLLPLGPPGDEGEARSSRIGNLVRRDLCVGRNQQHPSPSGEGRDLVALFVHVVPQ